MTEVGIDIDDVLARWYHDSHDICVRAGITNGVTPTTWRPYEEYGCTDQVWYDTLHKALLDGYLLRMGVWEGAYPAVQRLWREGFGIHLITARGFFQDGDLIREHTKIWLDAEDFIYDSLTFTQDKGQAAKDLELDYFIDDQPRNVLSVVNARPHTRCYLVTRPWNANIVDPHLPARLTPWKRVDSLTEFADIVIEEAGYEHYRRRYVTGI